MLKSLSIKNFTLIDSVSLKFDKGLNIIIGETGAGKSIIVDALLLALGERASSDLIRSGENKAIIEAVFSIPEGSPIYQLLSHNELDIHDNELITRRELSVKGNSRCFINDTPVQVALLKDFGDLLVDFHGQHDHQILLRPENHLSVLDSICRFDDLTSRLNNEYQNQSQLLRTINDLYESEKDSSQKVILYKFELEEIVKVNPLIDEETSLEIELKILENSEILFSLSSSLSQILSTDESSVLYQIVTARKNLEQLNAIDEAYSQYLEEFKTSEISLNEIDKFNQNYHSNINFDAERAEKIRERLSLLRGLRKKYLSYDNIFKRKEFLESQLSIIENFEKEILLIKDKIYSSQIELGIIAQKISAIRQNSSRIFEQEVIDKLMDLSIENGIFNVLFKNQNNSLNAILSGVSCLIDDKYYKCFTNGIDNIEFLISTNPGESPKPLVDVASGGEISRVMLAIKSISASTSNTPVLIFDEIDTGISGKVARRVGLSMKKLSQNHQIISITHLAQIASLADKIISVNKSQTNDSTNISASELSGEERNIEIAKLISGEDVTESTLQSIQELSKF
jgi:DNA repair protein RecN (Recombination protein N)